MIAASGPVDGAFHLVLDAVHDNAVIDRVILRAKKVNCLVDTLLQRHDRAASPRTVAGHDHARVRVEHAIGDGRRGKSAEDHAVHRADARAGEQCDRQLGHHAHVERDDFALLHAERFECVGGAADFVKEFAVAEVLDLGLRAIVSRKFRFAFPDDGDFVTVSVEHMAVERVVTDVGGGAHEPLRIGAVPLEHARPRREPLEALRYFAPEALRIGDRSSVARAILVHRSAVGTAERSREISCGRKYASFLEERLDI